MVLNLRAAGFAVPDPDLTDPKRLDRMEAKAGLLIRSEIAAQAREAQDAAQARVAVLLADERPLPFVLPGKGRRRRSGGGDRLDLGPIHQRRAGRLEVVTAKLPGDGEEMRRGARVVCHYDKLHARGGLTDAEREAADLYARLLEQEAGGKDPRGGSCAKLPAWMKGHPAEVQLQAVAKLRSAHAIIGHHGRALLRAYIGDGITASDIAEARDMQVQQCIGRIRASLTRLAEHWGMG